MKFEGVMTAIVSPFKNGNLDESSYRKLLQQQYDAGIRKLVINGTTGESPTLTEEEIAQLVQLTKAFSDEFEIVIGAGGNATDKVCEAAKKAEALGADAILSVVPYYNKPTQEGLFSHFQKVAASVSIPVILYNVPGRTITALKVETMARLSEIDNIVAVKEATGDLDIIEDILNRAPKLKVLSGDDGTYVEGATKGCHGVISVISHVIPDKFIEWTKRAHEHDAGVIEEYKAYDNLCNMLFAEPNPVPVKTCLKLMGIIDSDEVRLPLIPTTEKHSKALKDELTTKGILNA